MGKHKTTTELNNHKNQSLNQLSQYLDSLISSTNPIRQAKADKLCYWLENYAKFLRYEDSFTPSGLKRYKRGDILKVDLGYNVGSEEGGLHYAVVVEKENSIHNPVITIVPLTSVKSGKDLTRLRPGEVFLGNELFLNFLDKFTLEFEKAYNEHKLLLSTIQSFESSDTKSSAAVKEIEKQLSAGEMKLEFLKKMKTEFTKMKPGSIALVNQIATISKIRIYDPKTKTDILSGIKLSEDSLDKIDEEIRKKFTK